MIDWPNVFFNSLWITALSVVLSVFSWSLAEAGELQLSPFHLKLNQTRRRILDFAGALFCAGLAGASEAAWQIVLWAVLACAFFLLLVQEK